MQDTSNARRFLNAFHGIETLLRQRHKGSDDHTSFAELVNQSHQLVQAQKVKLKDMAKLRNAIAHTPYDEQGQPWADPRIESVQSLEELLLVIEKPPLVRTVLKLQKPTVLNENDDISKFFNEVAAPKDFSQSPVRLASGTLALVTTNAVARWIASGYEVADGLLLEQATVADVLEFSESDDEISLRSRKLKAVEAMRIFAGNHGQPPAAIIITESGRHEETPLGICVRADIPDLVKSLDIE